MHSRVPMGIGCLIANAPAGHEYVYTRSRDDLRSCDMVALSSGAVGLKEAVEIALDSKSPVIVGGMGTLWDGLEDYPFKHIVVGEGEAAFNAIIGGRDLPKKIRMANIADVDALKPPDLGGVTRGWLPVMSSRGCPFHCKFCTSQAFWRGARYHSAEYVFAVIDRYISEYDGINTIYFLDDLFIVPPARFVKLYEGWMRREWNKRFGVRGFVRADTLTRETLVRLREMGMRTVRFGAESGSDRILKLLGKGMTVDMYRQVAAWCRELGMVCAASFMHGYPFETPDDAQATKDLIASARIKVEGWYKFVSFPGTEMYDGRSPLEHDMKVRKP